MPNANELLFNSLSTSTVDPGAITQHARSIVDGDMEITSIEIPLEPRREGVVVLRGRLTRPSDEAYTRWLAVFRRIGYTPVLRADTGDGATDTGDPAQSADEDGGAVVLHIMAGVPHRSMPRLWINIALFVVTFISTLFAGSMYAGPVTPVNSLGDLFRPANLLTGWPFALTLLGVLAAQAFFTWTRRRQAAHQPQLFSLEVIDTPEERATTFCMATMLFVGTAANFLIPLYMQMVQGLTSLQTSFSIIPYTLSIFVASTLVARLYDRVPPRTIARIGFIVVAAALALIAFTIRNEWGQFFIVLGLITLGLAQGAIVALVFNTLLSASPKEKAGDVGAWRGLVHNMSGSVGIAVAGALAVALLSTLIQSSLVDHPIITLDLQAQINLDNVNFLTNEQVENALSQTTATPEQITEAVQINAEMRLRALRASLLFLASLALLAIIPAGRMPRYVPGDIPVGYPAEEREYGDSGAPAA